MEIKSLVAAIANHIGLLDVYSVLRRKITKSQLAILMYHRVCPKTDDWSLESVSPQSFEKQIEYFCRTYEILSLDEVTQYLQEGKLLPKKAVCITIDDGYKDNYLYAYPILKKYKTPATIFLTTGHIGTDKLFWFDKVKYIIQNTKVPILELNELGKYSLQSKLDRFRASFIITEKIKKLSEEAKYSVERKLSAMGVDIPDGLGRDLILSWDEVVEMNNDGITFGAHSVTHPVLVNMSLEQAKWEIGQSKKDIENRIGKLVTAFSYPNGDFNLELVRIIKESGFTCAVSVLPGQLIGYRDNVYMLSRIAATEDFNKFKAMFCGLWGDVQSIIKKG